MIRGAIALIVLLAFLPFATADSYEVIIQQDNTAAVTAVIEGKGLHTLELPKDAVPEVKGALYLKKGDILEMSIGSTEQATVSYKTKEYTKSSVLVFYPNNSSIKVTLPEAVEVISISPISSASADAKSFEFKDVEKIEIIYSMPVQKVSFPWIIYFIALILLILASTVFIAVKRIKK